MPSAMPKKNNKKRGGELENSLYNQGVGCGLDCSGGILGARSERSARSSSWRFAEMAFSVSRADFTAESSSLRRALSSRTASTVGLGFSETGGRGGQGPYL